VQLVNTFPHHGATSIVIANTPKPPGRSFLDYCRVPSRVCSALGQIRSLKFVYAASVVARW
jgi:hypothetical protein